jgi:hypothetical protein
VEALRESIAAGLAEAEKLHVDLAAKGASDLDARVRALTGPDFGEAATAAPPAGLSSLRALASSLANLATAVDGADAEPTPDAEAAIPKVAQAVQATLAAWATLEQRRSP